MILIIIIVSIIVIDIFNLKGVNWSDIRTNKHIDNSIIDIKSDSFDLRIDKNESFKNQKEVPKWNHAYICYYDQLNFASKIQKDFYFYFRTKFLQGEKVNIQGNNSYAFILYFDLLKEYEHHQDIKLVEVQFKLLWKICPKIRTYSFFTLYALLRSRSDSYSIDRLKFWECQHYRFFYSSPSDFNPDEYRLGEKYKDKLGLTNEEFDWLNKFEKPLNAFTRVEECCVITIKQFLLVIRSLNKSLVSHQTSLDKEVQFFLKSNSFDLHGTYAMITDSSTISMIIESEIYHTIFRRVENSVRDKVGHKRKVGESTYYIFNDKFENHIGFQLNKLILELKNKIEVSEKTNHNEAWDIISKIKGTRRKQITLDKSEISDIEQKHKLTVKLLNEYLVDDKDDVQAKIEIAESVNEEVETSFTTTLNLQSSGLTKLNLSEVQDKLVKMIVSNSFVIHQQEVDKLAIEYGLFKNQLIDSINTKCSDHLDGEALIEEDDENYTIEKSYYKEIAI